MQRENDVQTENKVKFHVFQDERFVDLNLYQYGWERTEPLHSYGPHTRNHYLFHYAIGGRGVLYADDQTYVVIGLIMAFIVPGQPTTYVSDQFDPWNTPGSSLTACAHRESLSLAGLSRSQPVYTPQSREAGRLLCRSR